MSIKLTAEASFDLDERRKVWITLSGDVEDDEQAPALAAALAEAVTENAGQAYAHAAARHPEITSKPPTATFQDT
jgi:hypothetical protein